MTVHFTSDLHFGHKNILKFCPETRPYKDVKEMDEAIVRIWNEHISPEDVTYILGDVFLGNTSYDILDRLNGGKILIPGNHDERMLRRPSVRHKFTAISKYALIPNVVDQEMPLVLFHFPIYEWENMHHGSIHLHGHVHGKPLNIDGRIMDVGWDVLGRPFTLEEICEKMKDKPILRHH